MEEFIKNFADQFDDTELSEFKPDTKFRDLDEWSSLTGLAIMNMVRKKYQKNLTVPEFRQAETVEDLYNLINGK